MMLKKTALALFISLPLVLTGCAGIKTRSMNSSDAAEISKVCMLIPSGYSKRMSKDYGDLIQEVLKNNNINYDTVYYMGEVDSKNCSHYLKYSTRSVQPHLTNFLRISFYKALKNQMSYPKLAETAIREKHDLIADYQKAYNTIDGEFKKMLGK